MNLKRKLAVLVAFAMVMGTISSGFAEPTEDLYVPESTEATEEPATGPVVEEYMIYPDSDEHIEPGSLSGDINLGNVGKGLFFDGTDFYFFLDTGIMASNFMYNIQGDRFYFGEDGKMVKDEVVNYDGEIYYFDVNGAMYKNRWYSAEEVDSYDNTVTYTDYYFGPTGRAYRAEDSSTGLVIKTIDGQKFGFNADGEKVEGYYSYDGNEYEPEDEEAYALCDYYFDPDDNGAALTGWHYYSGSTRGEEYDDNEEIVLYFDEKTCRKVKSNSSDETRCISRNIEGQRYMFDHKGVRRNKWYTMDPGRSATAANARYFSEDYDGYLSKGWFEAVPPENCLLEVNRKKHDDDDEAWYYAGANGNIYKNCIRKIGNYTYAFDADGIMQEDCLVRTRNGEFIKAYSIDELSRGNVLNDPSIFGHAEDGRDPNSEPVDLDPNKGLLKIADGERWMYFYGDQKGEDKVGSMCGINSTITIELKDEEIDFIANSVGGYAKTEEGSDLRETASPQVNAAAPISRSNKYIQNGVLMKPNRDNSTFGIMRFSPLAYDAFGAASASVINKNNDKLVATDVPTGDNNIYRYYVINYAGNQLDSSYRCLRDKQHNYVYVADNGEFIGYYSVEGKATKAKSTGTVKSCDADGNEQTYNVSEGQWYWQYKDDKTWKWGLPPESYKLDIEYLALNFSPNVGSGVQHGYGESPYVNGLASLVYINAASSLNP